MNARITRFSGRRSLDNGKYLYVVDGIVVCATLAEAMELVSPSTFDRPYTPPVKQRVVFSNHVEQHSAFVASQAAA